MVGWENFKLWSYFSHESNFLREKCSPSSHLNFKKPIQGCSFLHQLNLVLTVKSVSHVPPWGFFTITQLFQSFVDLFSTLWNMFPAEKLHNFLFSAFNMSTFYFKSNCKIKSLVMIRRSVLEGCCSFWKAILQLCSHVLRSFFWNIIKSKDIFWRGFGSGFWTRQSLFGNIKRWLRICCSQLHTFFSLENPQSNFNGKQHKKNNKNRKEGRS